MHSTQNVFYSLLPTPCRGPRRQVFVAGVAIPCLPIPCSLFPIPCFSHAYPKNPKFSANQTTPTQMHCHPESTGPQTSFSLGAVSEGSALKIAVAKREGAAAFRLLNGLPLSINAFRRGPHLFHSLGWRPSAMYDCSCLSTAAHQQERRSLRSYDRRTATALMILDHVRKAEISI